MPSLAYGNYWNWKIELQASYDTISYDRFTVFTTIVDEALRRLARCVQNLKLPLLFCPREISPEDILSPRCGIVQQRYQALYDLQRTFHQFEP